MRFALRAALLAAALLGFASPHAQAQGDVSPAECAAAAVGTALTVYPDVPLYSAVSGMETVGAPLRFRTRVAILPGPRKGVRIPVREADGARCGYVDGTKILSGQPLNVIDIDPDQQVRVSIFGVVRDKRHVRAMLRSNPKLDATAHEAQLFDAPGGRPFKRSRVFGLFNVFKVEKIGTDPDDWWYFIGGRKVTDATAVSGWVQGGNLFLWRGNLAAYSVPDNTAPFDIYTDIQSLMQGSKAGLIATRADLEPPADRDIFKFPILDQIFKDEAARKAGAPPIAYEIGFFGQGCGAAGECADAVKISDQLSKIGEIVRSSGQIDVVLVVENTEGMTKYLVPIARAVSGWARETSAKRQEGRVRFGAAIYGDYRDPRRPAIDNMDFRMIATLDLDASKLERALTGVGTPFGDAVGDRPGAGYAALVRAAREAFWAADAGYRLVIWIGSQGVQRDTAKLIDPVDVAQVQREVGEKKIFLAAISVAGSRPGKSTFIEDASRILDRSKMALGVPPIRSFDGATPPPREEPEMAAEKVKQLLDAVLYFSRSVPEWIESQRGKETPAKAGETASLAPEAGGLPIAKLVDVSALKAGPFARLGLTSGEVERVLNLKQMTTKGYVGLRHAEEEPRLLCRRGAGPLQPSAGLRGGAVPGGERG